MFTKCWLCCRGSKGSEAGQQDREIGLAQMRCWCTGVQARRRRCGSGTRTCKAHVHTRIDAAFERAGGGESTVQRRTSDQRTAHGRTDSARAGNEQKSSREVGLVCEGKEWSVLRQSRAILRLAKADALAWREQGTGRRKVSTACEGLLASAQGKAS